MTQENIIRGIAKAAAREANKALQAPLYSVTTTNATATDIALIELELYTGGILELTVVGKNDVGVGSVTAKQIVRYEKGSALTLGTPVNILPLETDVVGATFSISASSNNILIQVTGAASTTINWTVETKLIYQTATSTP